MLQLSGDSQDSSNSEPSSKLPCSQCGNRGDFDALQDEYQGLRAKHLTLQVQHDDCFYRWRKCEGKAKELEELQEGEKGMKELGSRWDKRDADEMDSLD
jgi:flagellar biosynthesis chaperone FliJ